MTPLAPRSARARSCSPSLPLPPRSAGAARANTFRAAGGALARSTRRSADGHRDPGRARSTSRPTAGSSPRLEPARRRAGRRHQRCLGPVRLPDILRASENVRLPLVPGGQANGDSFDPSISGDGRFVAFESRASNLVPDDTNGQLDVFVLDRDTDGNGVLDEPGTTSVTRVSVGPDGAQANGPS